MAMMADNTALRAGYAAQTARRYVVITIAAALLVTSFVIDVATGPGNYPLRTVIDTLMDPMAHGVQIRVIVWDYCLPIVVTAVIVGALLAVAGAQMQAILNDPLVEPFTLGVSSAASFGAALAIVLGWSVLPGRPLPHGHDQRLRLRAFRLRFHSARHPAQGCRIGNDDPVRHRDLLHLLGPAGADAIYGIERSDLAYRVLDGGLSRPRQLGKDRHHHRADRCAGLRLDHSDHAAETAVVSLVIHNLSAGYGRVSVLRDVTLAPIEPGQFVGLIGPNASGKSTLIKTLSGLLRPTAGTIMLTGTDLGALRRRDRARRIAYMPQAFGCNAILTVFESVLLALKQTTGWRVDTDNLDRVSRTLAALNLTHLAERGLGNPSGGQAQMVAVAQTLVRDPTRPSFCSMNLPARSTSTISCRSWPRSAAGWNGAAPSSWRRCTTSTSQRSSVTA